METKVETKAETKIELTPPKPPKIAEVVIVQKIAEPIKVKSPVKPKEAE